MGEVTKNEIMSSSSSSLSSSSRDQSDIDEDLKLLESAPPFWSNSKKFLVKQVSNLETQRELAWERRRRLKLMQEKRRESNVRNSSEIFDEDLNELKGCIELGFGFNEDEGGQKLANTLPALDIYFAVNRLGSPAMSPKGTSSSSSRFLGSKRSSSFDSKDSWKICSPGLSRTILLRGS